MATKMMNSLFIYPARFLWPQSRDTRDSTAAAAATTTEVTATTRSIQVEFTAPAPVVAVPRPKKRTAGTYIKPEPNQAEDATTIFSRATPQEPFQRPSKRPRPKSPKSSSPQQQYPQHENRSPLVRRIPSLLGEHEEFVLQPSDFEDRSARESTPRSKRLRRESGNHFDHPNHPNLAQQQLRGTREATAMSSVTNADDVAVDTGSPATRVGEIGAVGAGAGEEEEAGGEEEYSLIREADEEQQQAELQAEGFTAQEAQLFLRIRNRGLEPLLPAHWEVDFSTMPGSLFFPDKGIQVGHIDSLSLQGTFQATNALQALVMLGSTVRGRIEVSRDPEDRVVAALRKYIQWTVDDVKTSSTYSQSRTPKK